MSKKRWELETLGPSTERFGLRRELFGRSGGTPVDLLYTPDMPPEDVGFPGEYPYTRGVRPAGYRSRLWTMRHYEGFGPA